MEMQMEFRRELPSPEMIKAEIPASKEIKKIKEERDAQLADILSGRSDRRILIVGPCSADREDAVLEYINKLAPLQEKVKDKIMIVPRIYTNKPRTTGDGYKGMASQPDPLEEEDIVRGLVAIRNVHLKAVAQTGLTCADEMLYPENHPYLSDLLSYVAVGARSVENQQHRLVASGVGIPVGMKNPTSGDMTVMLNSITAAQHSHIFSYRQKEVATQGNPLAHAILRGYVDEKGASMPNYHFEDLENLCQAYDAKNLQNPAIVVDCNHSNSGKKFMEQIRICKEVLHSMHHSEQIGRMVKGFMIESYLVDGAQKLGVGDYVYGKSITDPCLGWDKTEKLILDIAEIL